MVNDLESAVDIKWKNTERLACTSLFLERYETSPKTLQVLYYKTRIRLSGSRERTKSGNSAHFKVTLPKSQSCLEKEWVDLRGSELSVTGGAQEMYNLDCKAVTIYLFYVADPWENLITVDTILPTPLTQIYNNINICQQLQESSK